MKFLGVLFIIIPDNPALSNSLETIPKKILQIESPTDP
jgi:hypothetical protein